MSPLFAVTGFFISIALLGISSPALADGHTGMMTCEFFVEPQQYNTSRPSSGITESESAGSEAAELEDIGNASNTPGDTIVIGLPQNRRYQVIVPGSSISDLQSLRACISDAFLSQSRFGPYLQAGSFATRAEADQLSRLLRQEGYRARVVYRR